MKTRLDILLVQKKLFETRSKAQSFIMAGNVFVNGEVCYKASNIFKDDVFIEIKNAHPFVSRGGLKLESALSELKIDVSNLICLDIGASTGGFTDCLLRRGAAKVYAVDVGCQQLHYSLQKDKRVINIEKVNFRYFDGALIKDKIDFITIDVSFISLDKILPSAFKIISDNGCVLPMIKPQFELEYGEVGKGVIRDEKLRQKAINKIKLEAEKIGFKILGGTDSALKGPKGNLDFFLYLKKENCGGK
ncbi:MAG: TlyA family RNA methyltransferase [Elusimicrobiota bacterium]|jgi:23S rRNA (cytidine1920-2'-O)/16S rRNA (cytidine1409-2'-O)-methyltransferase|nr:TlyA family RNA methyltransferase [Elusimicrobiota bacterium]